MDYTSANSAASINLCAIAHILGDCGSINQLVRVLNLSTVVDIPSDFRRVDQVVRVLDLCDMVHIPRHFRRVDQVVGVVAFEPESIFHVRCERYNGQ